jgi:23S rRNA pseudouridine1911/1915/1917 synthase
VTAARHAVPPDCAGLRLDVALARIVPGLTRARVQRLVEDGRVRVEGRLAKASARLRGGEVVDVEIPPPEPSGLLAQDLPLTILFEDLDLLVLDKAAGMVVHPARGSPHSTVVNALLHHFMQGGPLGSPETTERQAPESEPRLGLVHRLDKDTSGCLVVAKTEAALTALQAQWKARGVEKVYLALCHGALADEGLLDTPYGRHPKDRTRYTTKVRPGIGASRRALTGWRVRERLGDRATLAEVTLHTGRTHQIRVHFAEHGHPLLADAVYGGTRREARLDPEDPLARAAAAVGRQALHAWRLAFDHPRTGRRLSFEAPLPADLTAALELLRAAPVTPPAPPAPSSARRPRSRGR